MAIATVGLRSANLTSAPTKWLAQITSPTWIEDMTLLEAAKKADEQIAQIKGAFGAPGDHGYESREGQALYALYKFQVELREVIRSEAT